MLSILQIPLDTLDKQSVYVNKHTSTCHNSLHISYIAKWLTDVAIVTYVGSNVAT